MGLTWGHLPEIWRRFLPSAKDVHWQSRCKWGHHQNKQGGFIKGVLAYDLSADDSFWYNFNVKSPLLVLNVLFFPWSFYFSLTCENPCWRSTVENQAEPDRPFSASSTVWIFDYHCTEFLIAQAKTPCPLFLEYQNQWHSTRIVALFNDLCFQKVFNFYPDVTL